jgi:flagellar hook-associated protein 2
MSGVTLTATREQTGVSVDVTRDVDGVASKVQAMVDAANAALADINLKSAPKVDSSPLKANPVVRETATAVLSAVAAGQQTTSGGVTSYTSYKTAGVQLDRTGKLTFDRNAFVAAYNKDPAGTQKLVQEGLATSLKTIADGASNATTGTITTIVTNGETYERRLNTEIDNWDKRLELRKTSLQRQFSGLEVALNKMKNQSNWLSGQLARLG